ncbi:hypothetical protein HK107_07925 [Parvularcula sp. ZS-1/3]|uniref:UDP-N-acetyl-alpha-D-muramoyl-L-alanyl-L-glutamate epimerase n=1 Tax=Parvularcula mediterranea TaxID=2732508 RepID=A0A7Y3RLF2_9PROT|nr:hypothetical protein [Parvularcula mediterranea]
MVFSSGEPVSEALLALLQVALGVSTYKAAAATTVVFPPLGQHGRAMAEALYTDGLAEFFVRSGLTYPPQTVFEGHVTEAQVFGTQSESGQPIVAFGGGKDSYVAGRIVELATGSAPQFASVYLADPVAEVLQKTAPSPLLLVRRSLDPKLLSLEDAFSGHVPITAINILTLTIEGYLTGSGPILFANERSADEPTFDVDGVVANHQFSKSSTFEALVRAAVTEAAPDAPPTFSVLRPFSELWIGRAFARIEEAFPRFTSCNRNFRLAGDADKRWCGDCAKCAFTSLILAPFISAEQAQVIFGRIMLNVEGLLPVYEELCGLSDHKPWDCVGTINECRAALALASRTPAFAETLAVRTIIPKLLSEVSEAELAKLAEDALAPMPRGALPQELYDAALKLS